MVMATQAPQRLDRPDENGAPGTALMRQSGGDVTVFDRIGDPLQWVETFGKALAHAGVGGVKTEAEGKCLAFASLCKRTDPFDIAQRFHIIEGKLSKKSDVMLADFNAAGGKHHWIKTGDDGIEASLELTIDGQTIVSSYSMADAQADDLVERRGSRWKKGGKAAGEMMRARCTSRGIRMLRPGLVAGVHTPEEIDDARSEAPAVTVVTPTPEQQAARKRELQAMAGATTVIETTAEPVAAATAPKPEAQVNPIQATEQTTPPSPGPTGAADPHPAPLSADDLQLGATIDEIVRTAKVLGLPNREALEAALKKANPTFAGLESLGLIGAEKLLANLQAKAEAAGKKL